ncbi:SH3 domain-binding protein 2-like [Actinia tenebrosa]|uniref:SH3 domain-binding protein 2-like n=1 Tax=Actinia tenebrosa TaxID=6105 RepID=A0A6P8I0C0_ACTTE|nr:SH3 domain-binding protein 2-like [Actinia tenebrosa]
MGRIRENTDAVLKDGYLLKQGDVIKVQWHLRYFVLTKECLCYYKSEEDSDEDVPKGVIFFNDMSLFVEDISSEKQSKKKFCLRIVKRSTNSSNRTLVISTFSEEERNDWLAHILLAKAMSLVCDQSWIGGNDPEKIEQKSPTASISSYSDKFASAKEVLHRCKRRLSGSNRGGCNLEELNRRSKNLNPTWRHTLIDLSIVT